MFKDKHENNRIHFANTDGPDLEKHFQKKHLNLYPGLWPLEHDFEITYMKGAPVPNTYKILEEKLNKNRSSVSKSTILKNSIIYGYALNIFDHIDQNILDGHSFDRQKTAIKNTLQVKIETIGIAIRNLEYLGRSKEYSFCFAPFIKQSSALPVIHRGNIEQAKRYFADTRTEIMKELGLPGQGMLNKEESFHLWDNIKKITIETPIYKN